MRLAISAFWNVHIALVLDDVSEMPLETQSRIVKILHNAEFERIGGNNKVQVDTRVVATTSKNLSMRIIRPFSRRFVPPPECHVARSPVS